MLLFIVYCLVFSCIQDIRIISRVNGINIMECDCDGLRYRSCELLRRSSDVFLQ